MFSLKQLLVTQGWMNIHAKPMKGCCILYGGHYMVLCNNFQNLFSVCLFFPTLITSFRFFILISVVYVWERGSVWMRVKEKEREREWVQPIHLRVHGFVLVIFFGILKLVALSLSLFLSFCVSLSLSLSLCVSLSVYLSFLSFEVKRCFRVLSVNHPSALVWSTRFNRFRYFCIIVVNSKASCLNIVTNNCSVIIFPELCFLDLKFSGLCYLILYFYVNINRVCFEWN